MKKLEDSAVRDVSVAHPEPQIERICNPQARLAIRTNRISIIFVLCPLPIESITNKLFILSLSQCINGSMFLPEMSTKTSLLIVCDIVKKQRD